MTQFEVRCASTRPKELDYYQHGGILHYVLRQLAAAAQGGLKRGGAARRAAAATLPASTSTSRSDRGARGSRD